MSWLQHLKIDKFLLVMICVVLLASFLPARGVVKNAFQYLTTFSIALLFFMHGAKLSREAIFSGLGHWRLHLLVFVSTFALFPLLGMAMAVIPGWFLPAELYGGFLFLCALPATVQSAIAFTSLARGNVAAAVCSASGSSLLGIFISPLLVGLLIHSQQGAGDTLHAIGKIVLQLLLPFLLGHGARRWIGNQVDKHRKLIGIMDRSSILLVVYVAFSEAVAEGIWFQVTGFSVLAVLVCTVVLLALVLIINTWLARLLGFSKADEIAIVFCGSKKSLANGVPMANIMFPAAQVGIILLPLMIFHQIQLMVCALLAQRYARSATAQESEQVKIP